MLIENEFGEIGIDGGFLQDAGVEITEMNSGCICCSLVGDFGQALEQVLFQYHPDRIIIEPSGVGKLSDVIGAVQRLDNHDITLNAFVTVADATKCKIYMKNFGEFYNNQIEHAATIVLSRTGGMKEEKLLAAVDLLRHSTVNQFEVWRHGEMMTSLPVLILILLILVAFWISVPLLLLGLFFGCRYRFSGPDLEKSGAGDAVNRVTGVVGDAVEQVKDAFTRAAQGKDDPKK